MECRECDGDDGFTLVEVIASMVVLAILATAVAVALAQSLQASRTSRQRVAAANLISQQMDLIRDAGAGALGIGVSSPTPVSVDGTLYSMTQTVRWVSGTSSATDSCSGTGTALFKSVSIAATWPSMAGTAPVRSDTVLAPDVADVNANAITIPIRVRNRDNVPVQGVAVQLNGGSVSASQITDAYGCVVFANIPASTYTATTTSSTTPPSVNWQGSSTNTMTVGTTVPGTWLTTTEFQWDSAATLMLTPTAPDVAHPLPIGLGATVTNTSLATPGYTTFSGGGASVNATNLFPFTNGYQTWAGTCADADPQVWSGGARATTTIVAPGGSANVPLATRAVNVTVAMKAPKSNNGQTVVAVHAPDAGCPAGMTLTLGTTTTNAGLAQAARPTGRTSAATAGGAPTRRGRTRT